MSREKGQTLVEFALILPILLLVIFVIIESGRMFQAYVTVQHAAREGARYGITGRWKEEFAEEPDPRVTSIEAVAADALAGLALAGPAGYDEEGRILIGHYEIKIFGQNPNPPPPLLEGYAGLPNEKVAVQVAYRLQIITPILNAIAPSVRVVGYVEMINEDFGQLGGGGFTGLREPPSPIPPEIPTAGASPTPTNTPTGTITPTPTETGTSTVTPTPTSTPVCAVRIEEPVLPGDGSVRVFGDPGDLIELRDMDAGGVTIGFGTVGPGSYCDGWVDISGALEYGHIIAALSTRYSSSDTACVGVTACWPTSTPTATGTPTPTGTATPTEPYISLDRTCSSPAGKAVDIQIRGYNWAPDPSKTILIQWDGSEKTHFPSRASWSTVIQIYDYEATEGPHELKAWLLGTEDEDTKYFVIPCPPTPTPTITVTPLRPDLYIENIDVSPSSPITAYVPVTFTVDIHNDGPGDALSLFWVDLYVDPSTAPPQAGQTDGDAAWTAVSSLGAGETKSVILYHYFTDPDSHVIYGYVDTRENIDEMVEDNNAWGLLNLEITAGNPPAATLSVDPPCIYPPDVPMTITVSGKGWPDVGNNEIWYDGTFRVSTSGESWSTNINLSAADTGSGNHTILVQNNVSTPPVIKSNFYLPCSEMGAIDGYTWIFLEGRVVPHERTDVYCLDADGDPIGQTSSDDDAYYEIKVPPGGPYTVIGRTYIDDVLYEDTKTGIQVGTVVTTTRANLLLISQ